MALASMATFRPISTLRPRPRTVHVNHEAMCVVIEESRIRWFINATRPSCEHGVVADQVPASPDPKGFCPRLFSTTSDQLVVSWHPSGHCTLEVPEERSLASPC